MEKIRLQKYFTDCKIMSRRAAESEIAAGKVTVNGADCDPCWADEVWAGCVAYSEMSWSEPDLEKAGVEDLAEVAFRLTVFDADDWSGAARLYDGPAAISIP